MSELPAAESYNPSLSPYERVLDYITRSEGNLIAAFSLADLANDPIAMRFLCSNCTRTLGHLPEIQKLTAQWDATYAS